MLRFLQSLFGRSEAKPYCIRSGKWPAVRAAHLKRQPTCQACGESNPSKLIVHHLLPVHLWPAQELSPENLITLCESEAINCHLLYGHLHCWAAYNPQCVSDARTWLAKIQRRPCR